MSNESSGPTDVPGGSRPRRTSFTSSTLSSIFGRSPSNAGQPGTGTSAPIGTSPFPGPITTAAAADQHRRRMSISTMGLSGTSPTQTSPFGFARRSSVSTAGSDSIDENAIDDEDGPSSSNSHAPFGRRLSFGAQAFRAARGGGVSPGGSNGRTPSSSYSYTTSSAAGNPAAHGRNGSISIQASNISHHRTPSDFSFSLSRSESYNWPEQLRSRAESSATSRSSFSMPSHGPNVARPNERTKSVVEGPKSMPPVNGNGIGGGQATGMQRKPDAFQERMLKGDFCMD